MGRPTRSWIRKTYTVSAWAEKAIRVQAAESDIDLGTVVDIAVWKYLLNPTDGRLKAGGFSEDELERIFAEDTLEHLRWDADIERLAKCMISKGDQADEASAATHFQKTKRLVRSWQRTRLIEKKYQKAVLKMFRAIASKPRILQHHLVNQQWFELGSDYESEA